MPRKYGSRGYEPEKFRSEPPGFMGEVDRVMQEMYPLASLENGLLKKVEKGDLPHCSFALNDPPLTHEGFRVSLQQIVRQEGGAVHAKKHGTFPLAVQIFQEILGSSPDQVTCEEKPRPISDPVTGKHVLQANVVFETPPLQRVVERPDPYLRAKTLSHSLGGIRDVDERRSALIRGVKKTCRERGVGLGIMIGCYLGLRRDDILTVFDDEEFKAALRTKQWKYPSRGRREDHNMLQELKETLMVEDEHGTHPDYRSSAYQRAIGLLVRSGLIRDEESHDPDYGWRDEIDTVQPTAVLLGASQVASEIAAQKGFPTAQLLPHLKKVYGGLGTTVTKTVYLPSVPPILRWPEMK